LNDEELTKLSLMVKRLRFQKNHGKV
jgi:hypothetical protein